MHALVHTLAPAMHGRSAMQFTQRWVAGSQICLNTETATLQSAVVTHSNAQIFERGPPWAASAIASSAIASSSAPPSADVSSGASLATSAGSSLPSDAGDWFASSCASSLESSGVSASGSLAESLLESCETDTSVLESLEKAVESCPDPQPLTAQRAATVGPIQRKVRCLI